MEPRMLDWRGHGGGESAVEEVVKHLREGGLLAMPTETVYGFSCLPEPGPLRELQRLKQREGRRPFLLLIPGSDAVPELEWPPPARALAHAFWPGALTLVLADRLKRFPPGVRSDHGGVAVRVSPHPVARVLLEALERPLISTSANRPGGPPALSAREALETARDLGADEKLWVLDGGFLEPSNPSTIIDCLGSVPWVRRAGAIPLNRVRQVVPEIHEPV